MMRASLRRAGMVLSWLTMFVLGWAFNRSARLGADPSARAPTRKHAGTALSGGTGVPGGVGGAAGGPTFIYNTYVHFRYKPSRFSTWEGVGNQTILYRDLPVWDRFDWVMYADRGIFRDIKDPKRVLMDKIFDPKAFVHRFLPKIPDLDRPAGQTRTLVVAGNDNLMSVFVNALSAAEMDIVEKKFSTVWWEAKDVAHRLFRAIPMGFNYAYVLRNGELNIQRAMASVPPPSERKLVCASWGLKWPDLDKGVRKGLVDFVKSSSWINRTMWHAHVYFENLKQYKYMLTPVGNGIQSPKLYEAWLVGTVPVTVSTPAFEDLKEYGFPIMIIQDWQELTPALLETTYAEQFAGVDWGAVRRLFTVEGVVGLLDEHDAALRAEVAGKRGWLAGLGR